MSQALNNLLTLLNLEKIEEGLFRGQSEDLGLRQSSVGRSWDKRCTQPRKPSRLTVWCTPFTVTSCALAIAQNPLSMTLKC